MQQSPVILDLFLKISRSGKSHDYRDFIIFEKLFLQFSFLSHEKRKAGVFKFLSYEKRFRQAP